MRFKIICSFILASKSSQTQTPSDGGGHYGADDDLVSTKDDVIVSFSSQDDDDDQFVHYETNFPLDHVCVGDFFLSSSPTACLHVGDIMDLHMPRERTKLHAGHRWIERLGLFVK